MPEQDEYYDSETNQWVKMPEQTWTVINEETPNDEPESSEPTQTESIVPPCDSIGKRHKYKDRSTGETYSYCLVCGRQRPVPGSSQRTSSGVSGGGGGGRGRKGPNPLDMLLSGGWMGLGYLAGAVIPEPAGPAVSRTLKLEAAVAGPKLHSALKRTPIYPYLAIATNQFGWLADISMLLTPPLLVGLLALRPELKKPLKPMIAGALIPVIAESIAMQKKQAAMMEELSKYDEETIKASMQAVDYLIDGSVSDAETDADTE